MEGGGRQAQPVLKCKPSATESCVKLTVSEAERKKPVHLFANGSR